MSVGMGWVRRNAAPLRSRFCLGGAGGLGAGRSSSFALLRFLLRGGFVLLLQVWIVGAGRMVRHVLAMFGFAGSGGRRLGRVLGFNIGALFLGVSLRDVLFFLR